MAEPLVVLDRTVKAGLTFDHARQITGSPKAGTAKPAICRITRVTRLAVYYRNESGSLSYLSRDRFAEAVGRWRS